MPNISDLLEHQYSGVTLLMETLKAEQTALTGNHLTDLEAATAAKHACLLEIEQGFHRQAALLKDAGLTSDDAGMLAYLRQHDPRGHLRLELRWRQIKELFGRCREQNLLNGRIVSIHHRQTQRALSILCGGEPDKNNCYGPGGRTNATFASRSLGKV